MAADFSALAPLAQKANEVVWVADRISSRGGGHYRWLGVMIVFGDSRRRWMFHESFAGGGPLRLTEIQGKSMEELISLGYGFSPPCQGEFSWFSEGHSLTRPMGFKGQG